jgi:hypothetical protein
LCINMLGKYRSTYAKFRAGVAPLGIETGRYERLEVNERLCFNCSKLGINVFKFVYIKQVISFFFSDTMLAWVYTNNMRQTTCLRTKS